MMMRGVVVLWAGLVVAAATGLFLLKYEVIALEDDLASVNRAIEGDRKALHVLRAEWSFMNAPDRLEDLTSRHLGLVPVTPAQVARLDALPFRPQPTAAGPDDTMTTRPLMLPPRVLNAGQANAIPLPGRKPAPSALGLELRRPS